eukprot:TRINITY_DN13615_c0_g1_i1.p1 TRINITY_DN13615_c0_g1~~TRINITY_DN13615_c0_g1_i1.p1  ORF type:complete len:567 (+),score=102.51 TRINITY_DN13615_c0_g1_i1:506-2206(+)
MASSVPPVDVTTALTDGVRRMEPSLAIMLEATAIAAPLLAVGALWLVRAGCVPAVTLGFIGGLASMLVVYVFQLRRASERQSRAARVAATSRLTRPLIEKYFKWKNTDVPPWVHITEKEKVQWLNTVMRDMWPQLNKACSAIITDALTPTLDAYKMGMIQRLEVVKFNLGSVAPRVLSVQAVKREKDSLCVEIAVEWTTGKDQTVVLKAVTAMAPDLKIKVDDLRFRGIFKIFLRPLVNQLPGFGAVLISFREQPKIDMDIGLLGGDITKIPGMLNMIENIIRTSLSDMLIWPARIVVPIIPGDYKYLELHPIGYLEVVLLDGKDIPKEDHFSKSDPLVLLYVHQKKEQMGKSSVKMNNHTPVWNELFYIEVEDLDYQDLIIRLMDYDPLQSAEFMGSAKIPLKQLVPNEDQHFRINLSVDPDKPDVGPSRGQLHIHVCFVPYLSDADAKISPVRTAAAFAAKHSHKSKSGNGIKLEEMDGKTATATELGEMIDDPNARGTEAGEKGEDVGNDEVDEEHVASENEKHKFKTKLKSLMKKCVGLKGKTTLNDEASKASGTGLDEEAG